MVLLHSLIACHMPCHNLTRQLWIECNRLVRLSTRRAHDELSVDEVRQMSFDLDQAYNAFHKWVQQQEGKAKSR
jgi:hypothetical protein